jgi:hypothetical protein
MIIPETISITNTNQPLLTTIEDVNEITDEKHQLDDSASTPTCK